jgi:subtilase family serine protease
MKTKLPASFFFSTSATEGGVAIEEAEFLSNRVATWLAGMVLLLLLSAPVPAFAIQVLQGHVPPEVAKFNLQATGRLPATDRLQLVIVLPPRNQETLLQLVQQVQDPASTNFHHYLTPQQFTEQFGPTEADYQAVIDFAGKNGLTVTGTVPGRTLVEVDAAVADIEKTLHVKMQRYQHPTEARTFFSPDAEPSVDLAVPVLCFSGLNNYIIPHAKSHVLSTEEMKAIPRNGSYNYPGGGTLFMGYDFRHAFASDTSLNGAGQVVGLQEFDGYTPADITAYETTAGLPNVPVQEVLLNGLSNDPNNNDAEPPLDVQMAIAMAPGLSKIVFYYGNNIDSILTEYASPTHGEPRPLQMSSSWGYNTDSGTSNVLMQLALQGQSYLYAEGDEGSLPVDPNGPGGTYVGGASPGDLEPFMTCVGGTDLSMNGAGVSYQSETVWPGSAGGILSTVPIPEYQKPINMSANGGSTTLCNVPDVAMPANYILVVYTDNGGVQHYSAVGGTSCAAPLWAGFTALVNQQATASGKPPVGFMNPALYNIAEGPLYSQCFNDITSGNNTNSRSPTLYFAKPGFDLCTGWGTPKGANMINALVGFSGAVFVDFNYTGAIQNGTFLYPFKTLAQGTAAVGTYGTIFIITGGSSSETMTISKPMTITAQDGAATVGH